MHFYPTRKVVGLFHTWAIDTITNLKPVSPEGFQHLVVCVCVYSKWVEAWPMKTLEPAERVSKFHSEISTRYGLPAYLRMDRGTEF